MVQWGVCGALGVVEVCRDPPKSAAHCSSSSSPPSSCTKAVSGSRSASCSDSGDLGTMGDAALDL